MDRPHPPFSSRRLPVRRLVVVVVAVVGHDDPLPVNFPAAVQSDSAGASSSTQTYSINNPRDWVAALFFNARVFTLSY